jgi:hypothetical protein
MLMASSRTRYIPELVYALAFSSISVHLLWQRRTAETDRRHLSARLSILGELAARLRAGDAVSDAEVARLRRLAETVGEATHPGENVGWRDVMFGRKESGAEREGKEELERRELETGALRSPLLSLSPRHVRQLALQRIVTYRVARLVQSELHRTDDITNRS